MPRRDVFMQDLLRNQRRRRRRGPSFLIVLVLLAVGGAGYAGWQRLDSSTSLPSVPTLSPVQTATKAVQRAHFRAAQLATQTPTAAPIDPSRTETELQSFWTPGKAATLEGELVKDESLFLALEQRQLAPAAIQQAISAMSEEFNFRHSRPGDHWRVHVDDQGQILSFRYQTTPEDIWLTTRKQDGSYSCEKQDVPTETQRDVLHGVVHGSLWESMESLGMDPQLIYQFVDIFAYSIDFNTETQAGDTFALVFERVYLKGNLLRSGRILAARYEGSGKSHEGYFYESQNGEKGYYDRQGDNLQRQFLKSPLATIRVTSRFGRRFHPIQKTWKMHAGVDYGAPTGTPVQAVADGVITHAGWKGANGKLVSIRHANGYSTHYAHLSKISKAIRSGKRVTKKTVIGHVGSTGRSTGPHLHFGMQRHGKYVNPLTVDFMRGEPLKGAERQTYTTSIVKPLRTLLGQASPPSAEIAENP